MKRFTFLFFLTLISSLMWTSGNAQYCTAGSSSTAFEQITNVTFAGINNTTTSHPGYNDFTALEATVSKEQNYQLSMTINADLGGNEYVYAFIDWNKNGVLNDPGEVYILATNTSSNGPHTMNVTVPNDADLGNIRMRIILVYDRSDPNPCGNFPFGEVEDYSVNVMPAALPCPTGNITFTTQAEIDAFGVTYGHCTEIPGNVTISYSNDITNLDGLSSLTSIGGFVFIHSNPQLTNINGLSSLTSIVENLGIYNNSQLTNLDGISSLTSVGGNLDIRNNSQLTNLNGLSALTNIGAGLDISNNSQLTNLNGLSALTNIGGHLHSGNNPQLANLDGLSSLTNVGDYLWIWNNPQLANLDGLSALTNIGAGLDISNNSQLTNLNGFSALTNIGGVLGIGNNSQLTNLNGLSALTSVGGSLEIGGNSVLANLDGLAAVTSIGGVIYIVANDALTDISALANIDPANIVGEEGLYILNNGSLEVCNLPNLCIYLANDPNTHPRTISGNLGTCYDEATVLTACNPLADCPTGDVIFTTQAEIDAFGATYGHCTEILGNVTLSGSAITNLDGLSSLESIGGYLSIWNNSQLANLAGLSALTSVGGYLVVQSNSQLTNLEGLSSLTSIGGYLNIGYNSALANLDDLSSLESIGGFLNIQNNSTLANLNGLSVLTSVGGYLAIQINSQLTSLDGLSSLTSVGGYLNIGNNSVLANVNGLSSLTSIGGYLNIVYNSVLADISGLSSIDPTTITGAGLYIANNSQLSVCNLPNFCTYLANDPNTHPRSISGNLGTCYDEATVLTACNPIADCPTGDVTFTTQTEIDAFGITYGHCTEIPGNLKILNSSDITNVDGLSALTNVGGDLVIQNNFQLTNLNGLSSLESIDGYLKIWKNTELANLAGLSALESIGGYLNIDENSALENLGGLSALTNIGGNLEIWDNYVLVNIEGLSSLTSVGGYLQIYNNSVLASLSGLSSLESIGGDLYIEANASLTDISALANIDPATIGGADGVYIEDNANLEVCNLPNFCTYLANDPITHPRNISGNLGTCYDEAVVLTACTPLAECPTGDVTFTTQSQIDAFGVMYGHCTEISGDVFIGGDDITNLDGLSALTNVGGFLDIYSNSQLVNLNGLDALTSVGWYLTIENNSQLVNLNGLSALTSVGGDLFIGYNSELANLDGLSALTSIAENLSIEANASLIDISGLVNIDPSTIVGYYGLYITNNPILEVCNLPNFCEYLAGEGARTISGNLGTCYDVDAVVAACNPLAEWIGSVSEDWNTSANWYDNTVPTTASNVVINSANPAVINTDVSIASITIGATANLTVSGFLNVGDITVATGGSLVIANDANLLQSETATNTGNITVKRNTLIKHLDYTIWSSPVADQELQAFSPNTLAYRIYQYNTSTDAWESTTGNFTAGKGIMFRAPNLFDDGNYPNAYTYEGVFTGAPHNGAISVSFSQAGQYQGVGNPYPSNIKITGSDGFLNANPNVGTLYFWTNTNAWDTGTGDYVANNWATYSDLGGLAAANGTKAPVDVVSVGQGFVVETPGSSSVSFNNDMRVAQNSVFFRTAAEDKHRLWLNLSDSSSELNNILIGYMDGATQGEDLGIDSKMFNYNGSAFYSLIDSNGFAYTIQGRSLPFDDFDVVPLGFRAIAPGSFTVSLSNFDGVFAQGQGIFLKDNLTQTRHNLKDSDYTFVSDQGEFTTRFEVVYRTSMDVTNPELSNAWVVYAKDKTFFIETQGIDLKEVRVYDMLGRVVYESQAQGNTHAFAQIGANQVLVIKAITTDNEVLTKKVSN